MAFIQGLMFNNDRNIYVFNPTCEYAIANGNATWHPNILLQKMENDLSIIQMYIAKPEDLVLVNRLPSEGFIKSLKKIEINIPVFITKAEAVKNPDFIASSKNQLIPWGWSPAIHKFLEPFKKTCSQDFLDSPVTQWKNEYKDLYSKKFAREILIKLLRDFPTECFIGNDLLGEICTTQAEIETLIKRWVKIIVKAPWGSSGRGLQTIKKKYIPPQLWAKLMAVVKDQGYAIVEPLLHKALDLALQFELRDQKVNYLGISNFITDDKGQYQGNYLNGLPINLDPEILAFAEGVVSQIIGPLIKTIEDSDLAKSYEGNLGVDTLIFWDKNKTLKINPCLEINVRQSMGLLCLKIEKLLAPDKKGFFRIYFKPKVGFLQFKNEMEIKHPLVLKDSKIESGFFALTEATPDTQFGAYILV